MSEPRSMIDLDDANTWKPEEERKDNPWFYSPEAEALVAEISSLVDLVEFYFVVKNDLKIIRVKCPVCGKWHELVPFPKDPKKGDISFWRGVCDEVEDLIILVVFNN